MATIVSLGLVTPQVLQAQTPTNPCLDPDANAEECETRQRLRPTFSEEESRGIEERGFADSFLGDALNGVSDPLGGGTVGGGQVEREGFRDLTPRDRGLVPATDPTDVFIPIPSIPEGACCNDASTD